MLIRIKHPYHGYHHVYDLKELREHEAMGWEAEKEEEPVPVVNSRGPGRPKKMLDDSGSEG